MYPLGLLQRFKKLMTIKWVIPSTKGLNICKKLLVVLEIIAIIICYHCYAGNWDPQILNQPFLFLGYEREIGKKNKFKGKKPNVYYYYVTPNHTVGFCELEDPQKLLFPRHSPNLGSLNLSTMGTRKTKSQEWGREESFAQCLEKGMFPP